MSVPHKIAPLLPHRRDLRRRAADAAPDEQDVLVEVETVRRRWPRWASRRWRCR